MSGSTSPAALRTWTDGDGCGESHRYDDDCNWRSQDERDAHLLMTLGIHRAVEHCPHKALGGQCEVLAIEALDALYENGWKVARS